MSKERVRWLIRRNQKGHSLFYWYPPKDVREAADLAFERSKPGQPSHLVAKAMHNALGIRSLGKDRADAVAEAIRLNERVDDIRRGRFQPNGSTSLNALIDAFQNSSEWMDISGETQRFYREYFNYIRELLGDLEAASITRAAVREIVEDCRSEGRHRKAEGIVQTIRRLWSFGIDDPVWGRRIKTQIFARFFKRQTQKKFEARKVATRRAWTPEEARRFFASSLTTNHASVGLATALALYTSMDSKDIRQMDASELVAPVVDFGTKREVAPVGIMSRRGKTDVPVVYPVLNPWLAGELLAAMKRGGPVIVNERTGRKFRDRVEFGEAIREVRDAAGLPSTLKFRHLRHTRLRQAQAAGVSAKGLQAMAGHSDPRTIEHYTGFDVGLALSAIEAAERVQPIEALRGSDPHG